MCVFVSVSLFVLCALNVRVALCSVGSLSLPHVYAYRYDVVCTYATVMQLNAIQCQVLHCIACMRVRMHVCMYVCMYAFIHVFSSHFFEDSHSFHHV